MSDITITNKRTETEEVARMESQPAPFLAYFSPRDSTLVIVAFKLASRFFENLLGTQKKYKKLDIGIILDKDTVEILQSYNRKILFYRDPLDRFLGWYKTFVFLPHATHPVMEETQEYEKLSPTEKLSIWHLGPLLKKAATKCTHKKSFLENAYNFIMEEDPQELKNLLSANGHTMPLYNFFKYTEMDPLDFHVFDMTDISEFTLDRFGSWEKQQPELPITASKKNLNMMLELHDRLHVIYKDDYDILSPLVKKYPQEGI